MNPFNLPGPAFLVFYVAYFLAVVALALLVRRALRQPADEPWDHAQNLHPYEVAYLAGGPAQAVAAAVARLVDADMLVADRAAGRLAIPSHVLVASSAAGSSAHGSAPGSHPLERALYNEVAQGSSATPKELASTVDSTLNKIATRLEDLGLVLSDHQARLARSLPALLVASAPALGMVKVAIGVLRGRPVIFLVILCGLSLIGLALFLRRPLRSRRGDRALAWHHDQNAALETTAKSDLRSLSGTDLGWAVALCGVGILAADPFMDLYHVFKPRPQRGGSSSDGSWWGGGGCGGGGCGGGGCGGGCGGCGA